MSFITSRQLDYPFQHVLDDGLPTDSRQPNESSSTCYNSGSSNPQPNESSSTCYNSGSSVHPPAPGPLHFTWSPRKPLVIGDLVVATVLSTTTPYLIGTQSHKSTISHPPYRVLPYSRSSTLSEPTIKSHRP